MKLQEAEYKKDDKKDSLTYGEITTVGFDQLLVNILKDLPIKQGKFLEIGCGYGKLVQYMAEHTTMHCLGLDIDKEKITIANKICWSNQKERIAFTHEDIRDRKDLVEQADIIFMNCITWPTQLVGGIIAASNCIVIHNCYKEVPLPNGGKLESLGKPMRINCSWMKKPTLYYKLNTITNR